MCNKFVLYFQVDDIENKLDNLLELYEEDRRMRRIGSNSLASGGAGESGGGGGGGRGGYRLAEAPPTLRVRTARAEKQCSEPNSPVSRTFELPPPASAPPVPVKRPMNRGYSDVGTRLQRKKLIVK